MINMTSKVYHLCIKLYWKIRTLVNVNIFHFFHVRGLSVLFGQIILLASKNNIQLYQLFYQLGRRQKPIGMVSGTK